MSEVYLPATLGGRGRIGGRGDRLSPVRMETSRLLQAIDAWMFEQVGADDLQIAIGVWDSSDWSWYAGIRKSDAPNGRLEHGESTYGSETIEEALLSLCKELKIAC